MIAAVSPHLLHADSEADVVAPEADALVADPVHAPVFPFVGVAVQKQEGRQRGLPAFE